ncbi:MAG: FIG00698670: hypothetical protein [uncultured Gemmatimonadetes bacterium]|uniref:Phage tail fibers n=1 Tax=uncultured Gemmatimonadota bacterium TaxID=203437 RepID=A0A6J4N7V1_9BACT|nr:MAG: FIG00698670: hypothetical protein [uncultured Gemmatimonadota bacterium]
MADERLLPPGIRDDRFRALLALLDRWDEIDLLVLLANRVDSAPPELLYPLAWQFGVTGVAGWDLADTEDNRRELIRRAIELHRRKGTPWAIREALRAVGFPEVEIVEGYGRNQFDGTHLYDADITYAAEAVWANFAVVLGAPTDGLAIDLARRELLRGIVENWKNARSRLVEVRYSTYRYDGSYTYNGTMSYAGPLNPLSEG